jgi:tape measure domain-containing protein
MSAQSGIAINVDPRPAQSGAAQVNRAILSIRDNVVGLRQDIDRQSRQMREDFQQMATTVNQSANQTTAALQRNTAGINSVMGSWRQLRSVIPIAIIAGLTRELIQQADAYTKVQSQLRLVVEDQRQLAAVSDSVYRIAQDTRSALGPTAELYARLSRSTRDLGLEQQRVANLTTTINQAIQVGGSTANEAAFGVIQFGQALASGALRGDELRSVMEQMPRLSRAIAEGMGVSIGELRRLGEAGELTTGRLIAALEDAAPKIAAEYSKMTPTIGSAFTVLGNSVTRFIGELNRATGAGGRFSEMLTGAASGVDKMTEGIKGVNVEMVRYNANLEKSKEFWSSGGITGLIPGAFKVGQSIGDSISGALQGPGPPLGGPLADPVSAALRGRGASLLQPIDTRAIGQTARIPSMNLLTAEDLRRLRERQEEEDFENFISNVGRNSAAQRRAGIGTNVGRTINPDDTTRIRSSTGGAKEIFDESIVKRVDETVRSTEENIRNIEHTTETSAESMRNHYAQFFDYAKFAFDELDNSSSTFMTSFSEGFAQMVASGKFDFRSLAQAIIADLIRIQVRAIVVRTILSFFGGSSGATSATSLSGSSGVGALNGSTVGYAARGSSSLRENTIVGEEGMELLQSRNNAGARIMNNRDTQRLLRDMNGRRVDVESGSSGSGGGNTYISIEQTNQISTVGVTSDELDAKLGYTTQQAVKAAVAKVQVLNLNGRL